MNQLQAAGIGVAIIGAGMRGLNGLGLAGSITMIIGGALVLVGALI